MSSPSKTITILHEIDHPNMIIFKEKFEKNPEFSIILNQNVLGLNFFFFYANDKYLHEDAVACYIYIIFTFFENPVEGLGLLVKSFDSDRSIIRNNSVLNFLCQLFEEIISLEKEDVLREFFRTFHVGYNIYSIGYKSIFPIFHKLVFKFYNLSKPFFREIFDNHILIHFAHSFYKEECDIIDIIIDDHLDFFKEKVKESWATQGKWFINFVNEFNNYGLVSKMVGIFPEFFQQFDDFKFTTRDSNIANLLILADSVRIINISIIENFENLSIFMVNYPIEKFFEENDALFDIEAKYIKFYDNKRLRPIENIIDITKSMIPYEQEAQGIFFYFLKNITVVLNEKYRDPLETKAVKDMIEPYVKFE